MTNHRVTDYLLIGSLTVVWVVIFALHLVAGARTGLAQPAFFVSQPESADAYPAADRVSPGAGG